MKNIIMCITAILMIGRMSFAQIQAQLVERTIEVSTEEKNTNAAKRLLIEKATEKISEDLIREIIGEAKFQRNKLLIQNKIVRNSIRYVPFSKSGDMKQTEGGFKLTVTMKVNQNDLQKVLLENGLFYETDSTPILFPTIRIFDNVNSRSWAWWAGADSKKLDLIRVSAQLEENFRIAFNKNHFYMVRPQSLRYHEILPSNLKDGVFSRGLANSMSLGLDDLQPFFQQLNVQILLDGFVQVFKAKHDSYVIALRFDAIMLQNGRVIAQVMRQFETDSGPQDRVVDRKMKEVLEVSSADLAAQVLDAWQKGTIGSSLFRLTIHGKIPIQKQEILKDVIKSYVREIKDVKERVISIDEITYEIDSSLSPREIMARTPKMVVEDLTMIADSADEKQVSYTVKVEPPQSSGEKK